MDFFSVVNTTMLHSPWLFESADAKPWIGKNFAYIEGWLQVISRLLSVWRVSASNPVFSKTLKIELPFNPAIPLLGLYLETKTVIQKDTCIPTLIAALFTITQVVEAAQVPIKRWTDKKDVGGVCVYTIILAIKKNEILHLQKQRWPRDYFA